MSGKDSGSGKPGIRRSRLHDTSYSDLVVARTPGRLLFVAGQLAFDEDRRLIQAGVTEQTERCLDVIEGLLVSEGGDLGNIVKITTFLINLRDYPEFDAVRSARFRDHRPASSAVAVAGLLFDAKIEIEAIAFLPD